MSQSSWSSTQAGLASHYTHSDDYTEEELIDLEDHAKDILNQHATVGSYGQDEREGVIAQSQGKWDVFYRKNENRFFKDRRYLLYEFPCLGEAISEGDGGQVHILEIGCGAGNSIFPLLSAGPNVFVCGLDFSPKAVEMVESHASFAEAKLSGRCQVAVHDIVREQPRVDFLTPDTFEFVTMVFVLSAIPPEHMDDVLGRMYRVLKPGGQLLFRDYGRYDMSMLRFPAEQRVGDGHYVRGDGTQSYFFSSEEISDRLSRAGFRVEEINYARRKLVNRKKNLTMHRIWVHAIARKPHEG